ncbi:MAG: tetratricopeptide repeat protein [Nitrospinota bacterium]
MARRPADEARLIDEYTRLLEQNPQSPLFLALARLYRRAGMPDRAEGILRRGLEVQPLFAEAGAALGALLAESDRWEEAQAELGRAVRLAPLNLAARRLLARCYERAGDEGRAALAADRLALLEPGASTLAPLALPPPEGLAETGVAGATGVADAAEVAEGAEPPAGEPLPTEALAELYVRQGHVAEAMGVYERLLEREPANERYRARLEELEGAAVGGELEGISPGPGAGVEDAVALESLLVAGEAESPLGPAGEVESVLEEELEAPPALEAEGEEGVGLPGLETIPVSRDAEEGPVAPPPSAPEEKAEGVALEAEFEATVEALANLYIQDGLVDRALDLYKRARSLHPESPALAARMEALEWELARVAPGEVPAGEVGVGAPGEPGEEGMEGADMVPLDAESRARVIGELERWLEVLERRRAGDSSLRSD